MKPKIVTNFLFVKYFDVIKIDREIDVFSNDTSVLVKDDVAMVKFDVKSLIASIFSQLQVNYSKFCCKDISVLSKMRYS